MRKSGDKKSVLKIGLLTISCGLSFSGNAAIVINEIDYDQVGTDTAEFIELFNSGTGTLSLDNFSIKLINGNDDSSYRTINLTSFNINADSYFVVCGDASQVMNCDYSFTSTNSWFQNGTPDAVALYENGNLIDSLSYEGAMPIFTETAAITISDNNTEILSIGRISDGIDSNNNALDFELGCITPGTANRAGSGDCSTARVGTVPLPAAVWLFASGFIGLAGFARRN